MALPYLDAQSQSGAQTPYMVHLLLDEAVPIDRAAIVRGLQTRLGQVIPADESEALHFILPEYRARIGDEVMPVQLAVLALEGISVDELGAALRQSWTWPDAGEVAARCRASLTLADLHASGLDRRIRLALFHGAMAALLDVLPVRAIQWLPAQQVIRPVDYLERLRAGEGLRGSAVNVRRFRMPRAGGAIQVMDTIGLGAFGLPDLEYAFTGEDVREVENWLYGEAARAFQQGEAYAPSRPGDLREATAPPLRQVITFEAL